MPLRILAAIAKLTLRACLRSKMVVALLLLNLVAVIGLPLTVRGDGTAAAQLQVSLAYSLRAVTALVSLAAMWVGSSGLSREIEAYTLHLVLTKPAPRWLVWLGKWLGVFLMSSGVFAVSAVLVYILALAKFTAGDFPEEEIAKAKSEILVGRRVYRPERLDFQQMATAEYQRRLDAKEFAPDHDPQAVVAELHRQIKAGSSGVPAGGGKAWRFTGLGKTTPGQPVFVRYRMYVDSKNVNMQRETVGRWLILNPDAENPEQQVVSTPLMRVMSGGFQEFSFPAEFVSPQGRVGLAYENYDPEQSSIVFQAADGPNLLLRAATFGENWARGIAVGILRLALLSALGCVFGAVFSTPVAIFVAFAYLFLGAILDPALGAPARDVAGNIVSWGIRDMFSFGIVQVVRLFVVSFRVFDVTHLLSRGYLIGFDRIAHLAVFQVVLRGLPVVALGIWVFTRRELGKVVRR